jgi:putative DNA primase/helicase
MDGGVRDQARGRWRDILPALGISAAALTGKHGPCPICGGKDRFRFDDKLGNGTWFCSHCRAGDGVQLVMKIHGWSFAQAAKEIETMLGTVQPEPRPTAHVYSKPEKSDDEGIRRCWQLWRDTRLITEGDPAWLYLRNRRVPYQPVFRDHLRYHPRLNYVEDGVTAQMPALLAAVADVNGSGVNILRTYLTPFGQKASIASPRKLMASSLPPGSAVRLMPPAEIMGIAEGIETAIAAARLFRMPVWSAINSGGLKRWEPPPMAREIHVFGDNDENHAGQTAAYALANRLTDIGFTVQVHIPTRAGRDWNDEIRGAA